MEEYKLRLIKYMYQDGESMEDVHNYIVSNPDNNLIYNLNENGLHSRYMGTYYEPAVIKQTENGKVLFWLFDGDILDCDHPFCIVIEYGKVSEIKYYSTERKNAGKPNSYKVFSTKFSMFGIFSGQPPCDYKTDIAGLIYTPEFYPLCDQIAKDTVRFKFAD